MADDLDPAAVERAVRAMNEHQPQPTFSGQWACLACPMVAPTWATFAAHLGPAALAAAGPLVTPERDAQPSDLPSTEDVRFVYAADREAQTGVQSTQWARRFDAWLAEHDAQVAARALREAAEAAYDQWPGGSGVHCTPEWLNTRADRIERQEGGR